MEIGIVGLPKSGKTTIFNAVTRGSAEVASYGGVDGKPNIGVAKVPDVRLDRLAEIYQPRRVVNAEVTYADMPPTPEGLGKTRGIASELLNHLQRADAIMVVVRAFEDPSVTHVDDSIDAIRDADTMQTELAFSDLEILERRLARIEDGFKGAKAPEREVLTREQTLLARLRTGLEGGDAVRDADLSEAEAKALAGFQFLTAKPEVIAANLGEEPDARDAVLQRQLSEKCDAEHVRTMALCGSLEMELAQMAPEEEREFRDGLGVGESGVDNLLNASFQAADLISFFTGNDKEVRVWTVPAGSTAHEAAGRVHSDFQRGFIRAEVVGFGDLDDWGSLAEARKRGLLRQEGKGYVVKDGDVLNILFNV